MYHRHAAQTVKSALDAQAAVVLLGPRQVGKTTLAPEIPKSRPFAYLDLERDADRQVLTEPDLFLDEIQQMPDLFKTLRGQIDMRQRKEAPAGDGLRAMPLPAAVDQLRKS